ncbi:MAG: hypothetical protein RQ966_05240 [Acetobacteraceae bacterium]|nr:hypothetical protein [Acetobacteraceae bacterium]
MTRCRVWIVLVLAPLSASAQELLVAPDGRLVEPTKLEQACHDGLARFCPDLAATPGQTRSEMICLKPYRTSLSFGCRAAVNAALGVNPATKR